MTKKLLVAVLVAGVALAAWLVLHGRGHRTTGVATTTTPATIPVNAYFYRGAGLVPVVVRVPKTHAVATAAVRALLTGPPTGFSTAIPAGAKLKDLTVSTSGVATANFSQELAGAPRTAQAQIVYTMTQFPTVKGVVIDAAGAPVTLSNGAGRTAYTPVSRDAYVDLTPKAPIFVETPKRESTVSNPVKATGTAVVFEATFAVDVYANGKLLRSQTITTSTGAPDRGTWAITLNLPPGLVVLHFYETSAKDGSHLHETGVVIHVKP
jgi:sporulation and spore germination protein/immunoglobulin-like protein involved in spore germination